MTTTQTSKYPTKEEIFAELYELNDETFKKVREWKRNYFNGKWKTTDEITKFHCLYELVGAICESLNIEPPTLTVHQAGWCYDTESKIIWGEIGRPSIISTLHELGHHIFGESELRASSFSTSIFMKCFPNSYKNLIWDGHMLKKPNDQP